nr:hypothetical protein [Alphaproteobacteria bacterium]
MLDNALNLISLSLAFSLIGLNVFLTKKILNITDLTCDASFALGGCTYGMAMLCNMNPLLAFLFAISLGTLSGLVTSSFINHVGMAPIISSVVTLVAVQTVVLKFTSIGRLMMREDIHSSLGTLSSLDNFVITIVLVAALSFLFYRLVISEYGLAMRVCGSGQIIAESMGIQRSSVLFIGLAIGNMLSAVSGVLVAQIGGAFSASMGLGSLVFGLSAIIIGELLVCPKDIKEAFLSCFIGAFI